MAEPQDIQEEQPRRIPCRWHQVLFCKDCTKIDHLMFYSSLADICIWIMLKNNLSNVELIHLAKKCDARRWRTYDNVYDSSIYDITNTKLCPPDSILNTYYKNSAELSDETQNGEIPAVVHNQDLISIIFGSSSPEPELEKPELFLGLDSSELDEEQTQPFTTSSDDFCDEEAAFLMSQQSGVE